MWDSGHAGLEVEIEAAAHAHSCSLHFVQIDFAVHCAMHDLR